MDRRVTSPSWGPPPLCKQVLIGRALVLSEISKKMRCKSNHSSLSRVIIEAAFLRHKFTPRGKSVLWTTVVRSELPRECLPWTDFSPPQRKTPRPTKMVFDDIWPYSLCRSYGEFRQLARQTRHWPTGTVDTRVHVSCYLIHVLWCKRLGKVSSFTGSNAVFLSRLRIFVFWLFSCIKFCVKPGKTLNGSQGTLLGSFLWLDVSSNK